MAVAEFLENVDMAGLGLEDSEKMRSVVANLYFSYNTSDPSYFIIVLYHLIHFGSHASRGLPNWRNVTLVTVILAKCRNHLEIRNKCLKSSKNSQRLSNCYQSYIQVLKYTEKFWLIFESGQITLKDATKVNLGSTKVIQSANEKFWRLWEWLNNFERFCTLLSKVG